MLEEKMALLTDEELLRLVNPSLGTVAIGEYSVPELFNVVSEEQIFAMKGVGQAKTKAILAIREIAHRMINRHSETFATINSPEDAFGFFQHLAAKPVEEIWVALLDTKNHVLRSEMVAKGTLNQCLIGPREIFNLAVKRMAAAIIVAHNHPSGDVTASAEDNRFTDTLIKAGKLLGIPVLDHVIIGASGAVSLREANPDSFNEKLF